VHGEWRQRKKERGRKKDLEVFFFYNRAYSCDEKNPSKFKERAAMDRELIEKFIEVTGEYF